MSLLNSGWATGPETGGPARARVPAPAGSRRPDVLRDARVLVVEDEFMVAALLEDRLSALGCDVVGPAHEIEEAMGLLASEPIDAAVLDVNISGRMVFPVADALAARNIPFIFTTAYGRGGLASPHAERAVLDKPYHERALEHALRAALLGQRGN
jgi:CheY-like chemotaxis protein